MFDKIIQFSLKNKLLVFLAVLLLIIGGIFSAGKIPLDAVPDITNNQVQIVSTAPTLAPQEMEQLITYPLEAAMTNIPGVVEVRSISRYGLSVITIVFEENIPVMVARQYVQEQLNIASSALPQGLTEPELMPITTGLGEIYQYVLTVDPEYGHLYDASELRTIQDWIVKRQLNGTKGIIEVSSFGGYLKQYEIALNPNLLKVQGITIPEVIESLEKNNQNSGGSYIENGPYSYYIRTEGRVENLDEIKEILIKNNNGIPIRVGDIAEVKLGSAKRYGAMTMDGKGEVVGGITLMFKGANSSEVLSNVKKRMEVVAESLPEGVKIYPYLDRSKLIGKTIDTVKTNLIEGGLIVILVLLLLLGNFRAGLIVASVIPLSMLFALILMRVFGISANLMSLGAIDFGIVIDGAVIIVESLLYTLTLGYLGKKLTQNEMDNVVQVSTSSIYRSAAFGVLIILVVFIPILTLEGTEGKTFRPMAQTVGFAITGSLILSLTYVPVMASIFLKKHISEHRNFADRFIDFLKSLYAPTLGFALRNKWLTIISTLIVFAFSIVLFNRLGAEFVPTLEEGDIAMQQSVKPGSSLQESIHTSTMAEKILLENFPEVDHVVSKIGTAEVPTDPMAIEDADVMIILKDKEEWTSADNREDLMEKMKAKLSPITWASFEFTQPIQLRFNELMTGAKSDIAVKIFGEDVEILKSKADEAAEIMSHIQGAGDIKVDQTDGLQQLSVTYDRERLAQYGVHVSEVNQVIRAAYAGEKVGNIFEEERQFDLVVRIAPEYRQELDLNNLTINTIKGHQIPLSEIATIQNIVGPMLISREQARRFINIGINVRDRDVASLVEEIRQELQTNLDLPPGYEIQYGGQFENLEHARQRLLIAVPLALFLILLLLYLAFGSIIDALIIFMAVPMSAVGGILALWLRDMPFSISSGIGFIALFGVSVLNGIVLLSAIKQLSPKDYPDIDSLIKKASLSRLRPVLMTALVAALGFLPMAISTGNGAEVQRPLATVVIGGLITSTLLTLVLLPTLYHLIFNRSWMKGTLTILLFIFLLPSISNAQMIQNADQLYDYAVEHNPEIKNLDLAIEKNSLNAEVPILWREMDFAYRGGQINYDGFDHEWMVSQDISPLVNRNEKKRKQDLVGSYADWLQVEKSYELAAFRKDLLLNYSQWQYLGDRIKLLEEQERNMARMTEILFRKNNIGEGDPLAYELSRAALFEKQTTLAQIKSEYKMRENHLRALANVPEEMQLFPKKLSMLPRGMEQSSNAGKNIHSLRLEKQLQISEKDQAFQKASARSPNWSIGYFAQSLEQDFIYQGVQVGLQLPLFQKQNRVNLQQKEIEQQMLQNKMANQILSISSQLESLSNRLDQMERSIAKYMRDIEPSLKRSREQVTQKIQSGELTYTEYKILMDDIFDRQLHYLKLINDYNQNVINYQFLNFSN
jgi:cobalt-zinc-cadmium resistance protein CzcA